MPVKLQGLRPRRSPSHFTLTSSCRPLPSPIALPGQRWIGTASRTPVAPKEHVVALRKELKDDIKQQRLNERVNGKTEIDKELLDKWELTVGIEIHAELNTARKLFSTASTYLPAEPNTNVALFDLAYPGTQPHFQIATLIPALRAALALDCDIQRRSTFDRKHYFYRDQPAGYQITQYYEPFARNGRLTLYDHDGIAPEDGESVTIEIKQIQMEQDTAKILLNPTCGLLDFNRVSHPLIEIISMPQIHHPATAAAFVRKVRDVLNYVDAVTAGMEVGGLRADVNVSVRRRDASTNPNAAHAYHGVTGLGQRTEIKNISRLSGVHDAIVAERDRQILLLEAGGVVQPETRRWEWGTHGTRTRKLREKEGEVDYRYMPDPDLPPLLISEKLVKELKSTLPLLPDNLLQQLIDPNQYGLKLTEAKYLLALDDGERVDYYFCAVEELRNRLPEKGSVKDLGRTVFNWVWHELARLFAGSAKPWSDTVVPPSKLADIMYLTLQEKITRESALQLLEAVFNGDERDVTDIVRQNGWEVQEAPADVYATIARRVIDAHPKEVKAITEKGQVKLATWLVGQMLREMGKGKGKGGTAANPRKARAAVFDTLGIEDSAVKEKKK